MKTRAKFPFREIPTWDRDARSATATDRLKILSLAVAVCFLLGFATQPARAEQRPLDELAPTPAPAYEYHVPRYRSAPEYRNAQASKKRWKKAWIASWLAFVAVNVLDAQSSSGRRELNPLLRDDQGRFSSSKAAVWKSAIGGGFFALQWWLARRNPDRNYYKTFTIATGSAAAGLGVVAIHNYRTAESTKRSPAQAPAYLLRQAE